MWSWRRSASKYKRQPEPVEAFLLEYKNSTPRLILQYVTGKMSSENRARFRGMKKKAKSKRR